jgi:hypothetical protein
MNTGKVIRTERTNTDYVEWVIDKPIITTRIMSLVYPVVSVGHAKCDPSDNWNESFGMQLAYTRALGRASNKLVKYLVRSAK